MKVISEIFGELVVSCCQDGRETWCLCGEEEKVLKAYAHGQDLRPMSEIERDWCVKEADWAGRGFHNRKELREMSDSDLASCVLGAWRTYSYSYQNDDPDEL